MPFARIEAYKLRVDKQGSLKKIDAAAKNLFYEAASIFLKEVVQHVPVWSGMSRGSLRPLARFLTDRGYKVTIPISPRPSSRKAQSKGQNIAAGEARGEFSTMFVDGRYILIFEPKVRHYQTNEFTNVTRTLSAMAAPRSKAEERKRIRRGRFLNLKHPTPWQSFVYGNIKMQVFITTKLAKKLPGFEFKTTKISVGRARKI